MKKTQRKDSIRNITRQLVSWLSIAIIAMLAVMTFIGVNHGALGLAESGLRFYDEANFRDLEMVSTMLFTEQDISDLKDLKGVADVEGKQSTSGRIDLGEKPVLVDIISLTERINKPILVSGRLPEKNNECVLEKGLAQKLKLSEGDSFQIQGDGREIPEYLKGNNFSVTGIALYSDQACDFSVFSSNGIVLVPREAFDLSDYEGCYMRTLVRFTDAVNKDRFSSEYENIVNNGKARIERLAAKNTARRTEEMKAEAQKKLDEKNEELNAGKEKLAEARKELDIGGFKLEEGTKQLENGKKELDAAKQKLLDGQKTLDAGKAELESNKMRLDDAALELAAGKKQLDSAKAQLDSAEPKLREGWIEIENGKEQTRSKIRDSVNSIDVLQLFSINWAKPDYNVDLSDPSVTASIFYITDTFYVDLYEVQALSDDPQYLKDTICRMIDENPDASDIEKESMKADVQHSNISLPLSDDTKTAIAGVRQWDEGQDQYADGLKQYYEGLRTYEENYALYEDGRRQWDQGDAQYRQGLEQALDGVSKIESGAGEISKNEAELNAAKEKLQSGEIEYQDGVKQLEEGTKELVKAQLQIDLSAPCRWVLMDSLISMNFLQVRDSAKNVKNLGISFASVFILVGALVIYTTVGKIVEDQRKLLGTTKALGLFNREILSKYMIFGLSASIMGMILGILLGHFALQKFVLMSYGKLFVYPQQSAANLRLIVIIFIGGLLLTAVSVFLACSGLLKAPARELMQEKMPSVNNKSRKKKSSLPLQIRLILLNIKSDIKRVLVTIASIAGCCVLLVTGFTMRSSIVGSVDRQFNDIVQYDLQVNLKAGASESELEEITSVIEAEDAEYLKACSRSLVFEARDQMSGTMLLCGDFDDLSDYISISDGKAANKANDSSKGIWVNSIAAKRNNLSKGDLFTVYDSKMQSHTARVAGTFHVYMAQNMIISPESYEEIFGEAMKVNAILVRLSDGDTESMVKSLKKLGGVMSISIKNEQRQSIQNITAMTNYLAMIMVFVAGLMAFFILLNLVNMNLNQKKRELTVMRINGFTVREVKGYIQKESIASTALGIILGLLLGQGLSIHVLTLIQGANLDFAKSIRWDAWLISTAITVFYAVLINMIALRKVKKLKLSDM